MRGGGGSGTLIAAVDLDLNPCGERKGISSVDRLDQRDAQETRQ
jgi:hypothetical protein